MAGQIETMFVVILLYMLVSTDVTSSQKASKHNTYAHILQDSRYEPTPDGTFRYTYKTEDGIVSSAQGDPSGVIHGTFSYTDPTGLKVNYNYNAGSRRQPEPEEEEEVAAQPPKLPAPIARPAATPARSAQPAREAPNYPPSVPVQVPRTKSAARVRPQSLYREEPDYYSQPSEDQYVEVESPYYVPRTRPSQRNFYQPRRYRPIARPNDIYENSYY